MKRTKKFPLNADDVELLIKMENLISAHKDKIFNKDGEFIYQEREYGTDLDYSWLKTYSITEHDYDEFWKLIDRILTLQDPDRAQNRIKGWFNRRRFIKGKELKCRKTKNTKQ